MAKALRASLMTMRLMTLMRPSLFLFRRGNTSERRAQAQQEIFEVTREVFAATAAMKGRWLDQWEQHDELDLPPKYQPAEMTPEHFIQAARDARYARNTLQQNRWNSRVEPLFETIDPHAWNVLRATLLAALPRLLHLQDEYEDALLEEERHAMDRAVEQLGEYLRKVRRADNPLGDTRLVTDTTFMALYSMEQMLSNLIDRGLQELRENG